MLRSPAQVGPLLCVALIAFATVVTLDPSLNESWNDLSQKPVHACGDAFAATMNSVKRVFILEPRTSQNETIATRLADKQNNAPAGADETTTTVTAQTPTADRK